jgi:hypothetical protein
MACCREKKKEREREDLWRKMQDLSIKNAAKEGISLGKPPVPFVYIIMLQGFKDTHLFRESDQIRFLFILEPDPGSNNNKKEEGGKISCLTFICSHEICQIKHYLFLNGHRQ